jgi:hypothetical protein
MDAPNSSTDQEIEGDQYPSELPIFSEKDKSHETSDRVLTLVRETIRLQIFLLTIQVLPFAAGSKNKTYLGDRAISTHLEGAIQPRTRKSQVRLYSSSTCWTLSTPMGVMLVQAHRWPEARAERSDLEGGWYAPEKR